MRTVLCFGDSNTWGYVPCSAGERYDVGRRWPGRLQALLGDGYRVIEEGLSGRTTVLDNPLTPYRNGRDYLIPCLESHAPLDAVVIYLGTNDLSDRYAMTPLDIARAAASLCTVARESGCGPGGLAPQVLLLGLPRLGETLPETMRDAPAKAAELPRCFELAADEAGVPLLDLAPLVRYAADDGIHLDEAGHEVVAAAVAARLRDARA